MVDKPLSFAKLLVAFVLASSLVPLSAFAEGGQGESLATESSTRLAEAGADDVGVSQAAVEPDDADGELVAEEAVMSRSGELVVAAASTVSYDHRAETSGTDLGLIVEWDEPSCATPTTFHLSGKNGSGTYKYHLDSVWDKWADGSYDLVTDPSKHTPENGYDYQESGDIAFTFYASGTYRLYFHVMDMNGPPYSTERIMVDVTVSDPSYPSIGAIADNIAAECLAEGNATDFDKALWLHDWVIDHCAYDISYLYCGAEGALARGTGTCESYHRAYVMLLSRVGIDAGRITGNGHVWTAVKMDGKWYQVDATWNDEKEISGYPDLRHLYFGLNDAITSLVHSDHAPNAGYESNSLEDNYFIKTSEIAQWSDPYVFQIQSKLDAGETTFSVPISHESWPPAYKNVLYNLVAYDLGSRSWTIGSDPVRVVVSYLDGSSSLQVTSFSSVVTSSPEVVNPTYNGKTQVGVRATVIGQYEFSGTTQAVDVGSYTAKATPLKGFAWNDAGDVSARSYQWSIAPAPIAGSGVTVSGVEASYLQTGAAIRPVPTVTFNGTRLVQGKDYQVSWRNEVNAGTATMTIQGTGNFTGTRTVTYRIIAPVSVITSVPAVATLTYNGKTQVGVRATVAGQYTLSGTTQAVNVGSYTAKATPLKGFAWNDAGDVSARSYQWSIAPAPIAGSGVTVSGVEASYLQTGAAIRPVPTVTFNGTRLVQGKDYQVSWRNEVNAGTATMTIQGTGNFTGTRTVTYRIVPPVTATLSSDQRMVTITLAAEAAQGASSVMFPTWSRAGGQDDIVWYLGRKTASGAWTATVPVSAHGSAGAYEVHAYASAGGAQRFAGSSSFVVK